MAKKLQIFVSSTFIDMDAERQAVVEAILWAGHIPAGMELFTAGDESQMETIKRWIKESDVFLLILGTRYGTIEKVSGKSYIQLEYEYAQTLQKPYFAIVIKEGFKERKIKEMTTKAVEQENPVAFREFTEVVKSKMCGFYDDVKDLQLVVTRKLAELKDRDDLTGWVPGNESVDAKQMLAQMTALQAENRELRSKLEKASLQVDMFAGVHIDEIVDRLAEKVLDVHEVAQRRRLAGNDPDYLGLHGKTALQVLLTGSKAYIGGVQSWHDRGQILVWEIGSVLAKYGLVEMKEIEHGYLCKFNSDGLRFINRVEKLDRERQSQAKDQEEIKS